MTDSEIMPLEKALFILRHGSAEGLRKYLEAIKVIEEEIKRLQDENERLSSAGYLKAVVELTEYTAVEKFSALLVSKAKSTKERFLLESLVESVMREMGAMACDQL